MLEKWMVPFTNALSNNGIKSRSFAFSPRAASQKPRLVLISGCPGTGKSTFGMSVALDQGILKCISTDTVRAVMRSFIPQNISPALHRSSYEHAPGNDDPVHSWHETVGVLEASLEDIVADSIARKQGLVLEGVSIVPSNKLIKIWEDGGGVATGCLLTITKKDTHKSMLTRRGYIAGVSSKQQIKDKKKLDSFDRIRKIQDEMIKLARESNWILIEQKVELDPLEIIEDRLSGNDSIPFENIELENTITSEEQDDPLPEQ